MSDQDSVRGEDGGDRSGREAGALGRLLARIPRPFRFICVGGVGLFIDLAVFTLIPQHLQHPLAARLVSIAVATLITWRLNRALTFERSGRRQHAEAVRYAVVTAVAQGTSYAVFAALVLTLLHAVPQAATVVGAAVGAILSYNGHRLYAFAPVAASSRRAGAAPDAADGSAADAPGMTALERTSDLLPPLTFSPADPPLAPAAASAIVRDPPVVGWEWPDAATAAPIPGEAASPPDDLSSCPLSHLPEDDAASREQPSADASASANDPGVLRAMSNHTDVFVIGAGPAGLTAAYCLTKQTPAVIVIEKDPVHVGGISRTVRHGDFLFDIGGHRFFSKSKEVVALWNEILPDDFIERPRLSRIFYRGKFYSYPLSAFEALNNLGVVESAACVLSYLKARAFPLREPKTFHQWVRNQFGERLFSIFFKTYTEKVWGMSCDEISADWAAQRIKGLDLRVALINALARSLGRKPKPAAGEPVVKTLIETFQYPRRGPGMMWEAAAEKIRARGGQVLMGRELTALSYDANRQLWDIEVKTATGTERYTSWHVISSAPLRELVDKIRPRPLSTFNARALRYRDFLTVALMVNKPDLFPDNWIYIHDPSVKVGRVQNFRSWSPEMVPAGASCLGLEYFCFEGDGLWASSDADLIALATAEVEKIGLARPGDISGGCVVRQPKAYPVYDEDYHVHVDTVRRNLEHDYPNLHLVGRNGMHKYNNQDHAMMTAMLTAQNILAGERRYDVWAVNEDAEYHEAGSAGMREALASERLVPGKAERAA